MHILTPEQALKTLNEALKADPVAINELFKHRAQCNEELANHPTIQVRDYPDGEPTSIGMLGLINGIFGIAHDYGFIQAEVDTETRQIVRFSLMALADG